MCGFETLLFKEKRARRFYSFSSGGKTLEDHCIRPSLCSYVVNNLRSSRKGWRHLSNLRNFHAAIRRCRRDQNGMPFENMEISSAGIDSDYDLPNLAETKMDPSEDGKFCTLLKRANL